MNTDYLFLHSEISIFPDGIIINFCVKLKPMYLLEGLNKTKPQVVAEEEA